jgi:pantetheine-phosphate adenylyltransferase
MTIAIYPGSFDPPTNGHIDVVERASRLFDKILVAVVTNPSKSPMFAASRRVALLETALSHLDNAAVISFDGLTVDVAKAQGAQVIVKGLRATSDLEYELQMAQMNSSMEPGIDTLFIATSPRWGFISSSLIKEVARYGGDIRPFVPPAVEEALHGAA